MKLDLYHLHRGFHFANITYPILLDVLRVWAEARGWQVRVSVCQASRVDLRSDADVVGISVYTQTAPGAYRVADALRRQGKIVVLGGPHFRGPSTLEEAAGHCDVLVSSICEEQWHELLDAVADGQLRNAREQPIRVADRANRFRYPNDFHQSLRSRRWYQVPSIPTSLGCPYDCDFCAAFMQGRYLLRDIETIHREMASARGRIVWIADASFGLNKRFTIDLMRTLAPLRKKLAVETTLARLRDPELLEALAEGGVRWLVVGIETLGSRLPKHGSGGLEAGLQEVIDRAHDLGMTIQGNFICGLDEADAGSFDRILECCESSQLDFVMTGILTPYPDTALYRKLEREDRILDRDWEHYDGYHVVYRPLQMTVDQLIDGYIHVQREARRQKPFLREAMASLRTHRLSAESLVAIGHNLYWTLDAARKARLLRKHQQRPLGLDRT